MKRGLDKDKGDEEERDKGRRLVSEGTVGLNALAAT